MRRIADREDAATTMIEALRKDRARKWAPLAADAAVTAAGDPSPTQQ